MGLLPRTFTIGNPYGAFLIVFQSFCYQVLHLWCECVGSGFFLSKEPSDVRGFGHFSSQLTTTPYLIFQTVYGFRYVTNPTFFRTVLRLQFSSQFPV